MAKIVLLLSLVAQAAALSSSAQGQAWLRSHANPSVGELDELKGVNPEAYAIVQALLTKRSLGLLDPKHPSASFANKQSAPLAAEEQGPQAFAKFASAPSQAVESDDTAYPEAPVVHKHQDFFNWKPSDSASADDKEVQNVLGAVAAVAQPGHSQEQAGQDKPATNNLEPVETAAAQSSAAPTPDEKPVVAAAPENSYLKDIDFGLKTSVPAPRASPKENSYLRGSGLEDDAPAPKVAQLTQKSAPRQDFLSSFSWNDDSAAKPKASLAVASSRLSTESTPVKAAKSPVNNLMSWLDGKGAARPATAVAAKASTTVSPQNAYMMDLN